MNTEISRNNSKEGETVGISKGFTDELLNPSIDLATDYSEIYIDDLITDPVLKEIPIVKSVVGVIKAGISVNQFFFAKKLLTFIKEFNSGQINQEKKDKFKKKVTEDLTYRKKVSEQLMVFIDRFLDVDKAKISGQLFKAYVEEKISYEDFISIHICLERLHPNSYSFFKELEDLNFEINHEFKGSRKWDDESLILSSGLATETSDWWHGFRLKEEGVKLYKYGIKPLIKK